MTKTYSCIIIDDNAQAISVLRKLLEKYFLEIEIKGFAKSISEGVDLVKIQDPDIVFLDIEMPHENGIALFDYLPRPRFKTIFTTAFEEYAAKAFRLNSTDYLVKPIKPSELKEAISKAIISINQKVQSDSRIIIQKSQTDKIAFTGVDSIEVMTIEDIIYCRAENNYTLVHTEHKNCFVSKTLGYYEEALTPYGFFRISRSCLINMRYIDRVDKTVPEVILVNNINLAISGRRKKQFLEMLSGYVE